MTKLNELPIDVLALLLRFAEAVELFKCGNKRLIMLLANGGARRVELRDYLWNTTSRFPKCLTVFRGLRELKIVRGRYRLMDSEAFGLALRQLPTLESLKLDCKESMQAFILPSSPADLFSRFEPHFNSEQVPFSSEYSIWSIKDHFPRLKTLNINSPFSREFVWIENDVLLLPDTLTSLSLPTFETQPPSIYGKLPRGLTHLNVGSTLNIPEAAFQLLPPRLTHLQYEAFNGSEENIHLLPKSITKMPSPQAVPWNHKVASLLPEFISGLHITSVAEDSFESHPSLKLLSGSTKPSWSHSSTEIKSQMKDSSPSGHLDSWHAALPSFLTYLSFHEPSWPMDAKKVSLLPKTLKNLELCLMDWSGLNASFRPFPPLTRLRVVETTNFSGDSAESLPSSLIEFCNIRVRNVKDCGISPWYLPNFPRSIITFKLLFGKEIDGVPEGLPKNLNYLYIAPGRLLPPLRFTNFPDYLQVLSVPSPYVWDAKTVGLLPRMLTNLNVESTALTADSIPLLPRTLIFLSVAEFVSADATNMASRSWRRVFRASYNMQDDARESDEEWDVFEDGKDESMGSLYEDYSTDDEDDEDDDEVHKPKLKRRARDFDIAGFPDSLLSLYMRENIHYSPRVFLHLPKSLRSFTTGILVRESLKTLPPKLINIDARVVGPIEDDDIAALPKSITSMFLRFCDVSCLSKDAWKVFPELIERTTSYDYHKYLNHKRAEYDRILHGPIETPDPRVIKRFHF